MPPRSRMSAYSTGREAAVRAATSALRGDQQTLVPQVAVLYGNSRQVLVCAEGFASVVPMTMAC